MKTFAAQMDDITVEIKRREQRLFERVDEHVGRSIRIGSEITAAPGQPVKTGELLRSWRHLGSTAARLTHHISNCPYAGVIEHNERGATLRSKVGGFHSVTLTKNGFRNIVRFELMAVKAENSSVVGMPWGATMIGRYAEPSNA